MNFHSGKFQNVLKLTKLCPKLCRNVQNTITISESKSNIAKDEFLLNDVIINL